MGVIKVILVVYVLIVLTKFYMDVRFHMNQRLKTYIAKQISSEVISFLNSITALLSTYRKLRQQNR